MHVKYKSLIKSYSYLNFHCLDDFHYLDHFDCLHDLQKNWNLMYILKLAVRSHIDLHMQYVIMTLASGVGGAITKDVSKLLFRYCNLLYL